MMKGASLVGERILNIEENRKGRERSRTAGHVSRLASRLLPLLSLVYFALLSCSAETPAAKPATYPQSYTFGEDWFTPNIPHWKEHLQRFRGQRDLNYLEIGPYEGRSFFWMLHEILTHPTSKATGIDIFDTSTGSWYADNYEKTFRENVQRSGRGDDITILKGYSQIELRSLPVDSYDLMYVDGSHNPKDVLSDIVLSWGLLKEDGILILDDYIWHPEWPFDQTPRIAIDTFISIFGNEIEVIHRKSNSTQVLLRKIADRCAAVHYEGCSYVGRYLFDWNGERALIRADDGERVEVTAAEMSIIERVIRTKKFGQPGISLTPELANDRQLLALDEKLNLGLRP